MAREHLRSAFGASAIALALLFAGTTAACSDTWPDARPADFAINDDYSAGMLPRYWRMNIKGLEGRYEARKDAERTSFSFRIAASEADALYRLFRASRFDRIEIENRGRVHDRGGRSISVSFGRTSIRKSNSGEDFVAKSSYTEWRAVSAALDRLRARILRDHAKQK